MLNTFKLLTLCAHLYLFVVCILFAPVISTRIHRCVNNSSDIKVLKKVIEIETFNVDFISQKIHLYGLFGFSAFLIYIYIYIIYIYIYIYIRGSLNKFPDFFRMGTFIDSRHTKTLVPFEVISSGFNAGVILFQQLLEHSMQVLLCELVNDLHHSLFNCIKRQPLSFSLSLGNKQKSQGARSGL